MDSGKMIAILQSNYIPWKGYFDLINMVDEFILYDSAQYTKNDWRNRNRIKTQSGVNWLSIPIIRSNHLKKINETTVGDNAWAKKHWQTISQNYARAKYFKDYKEIFREAYEKLDNPYLSRINYNFIKLVCDILGIETRISWDTDYRLTQEGKNEKLIELCQQTGATGYLSGPAAKDYLDPALFAQEGIRVSFMDYSGYSEYNQLFPPFEHSVTILDLLFNEGPNAKNYMKSFK